MEPMLYRDSVTLMSLASSMESLGGVQRAGAVMATPANLAILEHSDMLPDGLKAEPNDLLIVVRAVDEEKAAHALEIAKNGLSTSASTEGLESLDFQPKTVIEALEMGQESDLVAISVPGPFAAAVAQDALQRGLNVFCFSDNVEGGDENRLKSLAAEKGLLMMGPDCGTALINGTPLGFVNELPSGPVGIIAASGTGAQEVSTLLASAGIGISQIVGVGGRDLSGLVDYPATYEALKFLENDPKTEVIVVVSKPPSPVVVAALLSALEKSNKPCIACLVGAEDSDGSVPVRSTLEAAAGAVASRYDKELDTVGPDVTGSKKGTMVTGLYTGGTLAHEAEYICSSAAVPYSVIDLGDDEYTRGRPHPMISPDLRAELIEDLGPEAGVLVIDLVLGLGSSNDPAGPVAKAVNKARAKGYDLPVLASITGTSMDHQNMADQTQILRNAGIAVFPSNAAAVRKAVEMVREEN